MLFLVQRQHTSFKVRKGQLGKAATLEDSAPDAKLMRTLREKPRLDRVTQQDVMYSQLEILLADT
jgi:hypothetical protein